MKTGLYVGVMSGTSLDGVDTVLARIDEQSVQQLASFYQPMPAALRQRILQISQGAVLSLAELGRLDAQLGLLFAETVQLLLQKGGVKACDVVGIGCHGQTVWHEPEGDLTFSLQIGDNNRVAALTGITTVGDFRRRDMVIGGQGAPLVPLFHQVILSHPTERRVVANIGGIANISLLFPGKAVQGFDTGPGNVLMDAWIMEHQGKRFDEDALWAREGRVNETLLHLFLQDPYFRSPFPKSTGREYFNLAWLKNNLQQLALKISPVDVQASLAELTAVTLANQIIETGGSDRLLLCGGGARNPLLVERLTALLSKVDVAQTTQYGIDGDDMEALAFAWLAARTLSGLPGNLPSVTGARQETVLGAIYPVTSAKNSGI